MFFFPHSPTKTYWAGPLTTVTLTATAVTAVPWPLALELLRWASGAVDGEGNSVKIGKIRRKMCGLMEFYGIYMDL